MSTTALKSASKSSRESDPAAADRRPGRPATRRATPKGSERRAADRGEDRRSRGRSAPGFASRKGEARVDGLTRSELVLKFTTKVRSIAGQISHRLPSWVDIEDLVGVGFIGLMDAADKYDPSRGVKFESYAGIRIRGAMLDELRNQDWVPRTARTKAKNLEAALEKLTVLKGRTPSDAEMAHELEVSAAQYEKYKRDIGALQMVSFPDVNQVGENDTAELGAAENLVSDGNPFAEVSRKDAKGAIQELLATLPEQERIVLSCYYFRGLNLKEIGSILSLSDARISQIHTAAIQRIKRQLAGEPKASGREKVPSNEALLLMLLDME